MVENIFYNSIMEHLHYADGAGTPLYSGNISSLTWAYGTEPDRGYRFSYDGMSRLVNAEYGENGFSTALGNYNERAGYDGYGNITSLVRNGLMQNGNYGAIDSLSIDYEGTQMLSVTEEAAPVLYEKSMDVKGSSDEIQYNANGALVADGTRGITNIAYDDCGNPRRIQFTDGNVTRYIYSATGQKLRTVHYTAPANIHVSMGEDYDIEHSYLAADSTDYLLGGSVVFTNNRFSKILFDGGYISNDDYAYTYNAKANNMLWLEEGDTLDMAKENSFGVVDDDELAFRFYNKDHLGNNREVIDQTGMVCQVVDYYPYGTPFSGPSYTINSSYQPFKYNGKEFDNMHGLNTYDYGARQYYSVLPVWDRPDPLAEKYYGLSPYVYCLGNPIKFIDKFGLKPTEEEAARIADHVCDIDKKKQVKLVGGWKVSNRQIKGVTLKDNDSGFKSALYERTIDGITEYVYATAGTDIDSPEDWENNIMQIFGASEQYNISKDNADKISTAIGEQELTFVGYSLGGGLAATNAYKTGRSAMTFNAAWVSPLTIAPWNRKGAKIDAYVHVRDELNIFQQTHMGVRANGNIHWRNKNRAIMGHSIKNFYPSGKEMIMQKSKNAQSQYTLNTNNILFGF